MATTTLIVGAGASKDYGLPTGPELQRAIIRFLKPDDAHDLGLDIRIMEVLGELQRETFHNSNAFVETCRWIASALPLSPSIDSFLETHSAKNHLVGRLGKFAIARLIAEREQASALNNNNPAQVDFGILAQSWLGQLWARGLRGVAADNPRQALGNYRIITFNYDRCIEQFMRLVYQHFFQSSRDEAQEFVDSLEIIHVYGSLGPSGGNLDFGLIQSSAQSLEAMNNLRTYSEKVDDDTSARIRQILDTTERVIFLGFSFAKINTDFLGATPLPEKSLREASIQVLGTSYEMSHWDQQAAMGWANNWLRGGHPGTRLESVTAAGFFTSNSITF